MDFLLDTHTFLWFINGSNQLSSTSKKTIQNPNNTKYISIASLWEIAIKIQLDKLKLHFTFDELKNQILQNGFQILPIIFEHTAQISNLELIHRDPFDRLIIAQAIVEQLTIITKDDIFGKYSTNVTW